MAVWRNSGRGGSIANTGNRAGDRDHVPAQVSRSLTVNTCTFVYNCIESCSKYYTIMGVPHVNGFNLINHAI